MFAHGDGGTRGRIERGLTRGARTPIVVNGIMLIYEAMDSFNKTGNILLFIEVSQGVSFDRDTMILLPKYPVNNTTDLARRIVLGCLSGTGWKSEIRTVFIHEI